MKQEFDKRFGTTWHVIVGRNFGSYVTHETRHFIYFYLGQIAFLIFKYAAVAGLLLIQVGLVFIMQEVVVYVLLRFYVV